MKIHTLILQQRAISLHFLPLGKADEEGEKLNATKVKKYNVLLRCGSTELPHQQRLIIQMCPSHIESVVQSSQVQGCTLGYENLLLLYSVKNWHFDPSVSEQQKKAVPAKTRARQICPLAHIGRSQMCQHRLICCRFQLIWKRKWFQRRQWQKKGCNHYISCVSFNSMLEYEDF